MPTLPRYVFHLLPNAHLDPVWLWDWREGLSEGLTTITTVLDLLDEYPELTFIRGEAAIYQHIQKTSPKVFDRILKQIEAGRWDVVGGTHVQPDSNLSSTETLCRHFESALSWFDKEIGARPRIGWQADSFGHPAGWPNILRSFGMEGFTFTRPQRTQFPMESPAFWWDCDYGDRLLCYRQHWKWYCSERGNMPKVLDRTLAGAQAQSYRNVGVLMGLGNHGGGPTRRHLADVLEWGKSHPEVELRYSTLHGFFDELRAEIDGPIGASVPSLRGEFGYCLRGCYSSVQKFKSLFRTAETGVVTAEISAGSHRQPTRHAAAGIARRGLAIHSLQQLPRHPPRLEHRTRDGGSTRLGGPHHSSRPTRATRRPQHTRRTNRHPRANRRGARPALRRADPRLEPVDAAVPRPRRSGGVARLPTDLELRKRPLELPFHVRDEKGRLLPFQEIATEHTSMADLPWRKRAVVAVEIPAFGWRVVRMGLAVEKPAATGHGTACHAETGRKPSISNGEWKVAVERNRVAVTRNGRNFLLSNRHLRLLVMEIGGARGAA